MKKIKRFILLLIAMMAMISIIGFVGSYEFASEIVYGLTKAQYDSIVNDIGENASEKQVAKQYLENKKRYDSIK